MEEKLLLLYDIAEQEKIPIHCLPLKKSCGVSVKIENTYNIAIKKHLKERIERDTLAHELGHCLTGSLYYLTNKNNPCYKSNIGWAECKANNWAIKTLVPLSDLKNALMESHNFYEGEKYIVAEMLNISISQVDEAITYYKNKNLL